MGYVDKVVKHKHNGVTLRKYCLDNNISYTSVFSKIKKGIPIEEAVRITSKKYIKYDEVKDLSCVAEEYRRQWIASDINTKKKIKQTFFSIDASEKQLSYYWESIVTNKKLNNIKETEIWKTIKEHPKYQVSNYGRFRRQNISSTAKYSKIIAFPHQKRCRKNGPTKIVLFVKLGQKEYPAKKIVANAFVDNPNSHNCVLQIDSDYKNIRADNLRWVSASYIGKITGHLSKGMQVQYTNLITKEKDVYRSARDCAKHLGISYQTVLDYCHKRVKKPKYKIKFVR